MWLPTSKLPDQVLLRSTKAARSSRTARALAAGIFALGVLSAATPSACAQENLTAENCSSIVKNITASEGSNITVNIAGADCSGASGVKLRVTYYWLDDEATGQLLSGYLPPALRQVLGRDFPIVRNDVLNEVDALFERFGEPLPVPAVEGSEITVCLAATQSDESCDTGESGAAYSQDRQENAPASADARELPSLDFFIPLPKDENIVAKTDDWPAGFQFFYTDDETAADITSQHEAGEDILAPPFFLWRPLELSDLQNLRSRLRAYLRGFIAGELPAFEIAQFVEDAPSLSSSERKEAASFFMSAREGDLKAAKMLEYVSKDGVSQGLATVSISEAGCDEMSTIKVEVDGPEFRFLIGLIENVGGNAVTFDEIRVLSSESTPLRPLPNGNPAPDETWSEKALPFAQLMFGPGEGVIVPMRIEFRSGPVPLYMQDQTGMAYKALRALPGETPILLQSVKRTKPAASFGPHVPLPGETRFAFGPEIRLKEVRLQDQQIALRQVDPASISLQVGFEVGSCPYVYGYNGARAAWELQSRALVGATRRELAFEDRFRLDSFDGRLKIAEVEPEVSFIDEIRVEVTLSDGSVRQLVPADWNLKARDSSFFIVAYPDATEVMFPDFRDIDPGTIREIHARFFGYYRELGLSVQTASTRSVGPLCRPPLSRLP